MSVKYTVRNLVSGTDAIVIYDGEGRTPEEALAAVAVLTGTKSSEKVATRRPQVGDRVVALKDSEDNECDRLVFNKGETGEVTHVDLSTLPFQVDWDRGETLWAREDEVAVIG